MTDEEIEYSIDHNIFNHNGRAVISVKTNNGKSTVSAKVEKVPTVFINL